MSASISRFLLPRGYITPYSHSSKFVNSPQVVYRTFPSCRNASASTSKPLVLEKPTRFNPPSHGKRLKEQVPRQYGPQLTQNQKVEQQTKKYPNMMPPRGTWMYWFLTNSRIHTWISMVRGHFNSYVHCQKLQSSSKLVTLNHPNRAPSLFSLPLSPMKDGALPTSSARGFPILVTS